MASAFLAPKLRNSSALEYILQSTTSLKFAEFTFTNLICFGCFFFLFSIYLWHVWLNSTRDRKNPLPLPPGFMGVPFFGNTPFVPFEIMVGDIFEFLYKLHGLVYKVYIIGQPTVRLGGPDNCSKVFNSKSVTTNWPRTVRTLLGPGSVSQNDGPAHRQIRRLIGTAFTKSSLAGYVGTMQKAARKQLIEWQERGKEVIVYSEAKNLAFSVAWELLVGLPLDSDNSELLTKSFTTFVNGFVSVYIYFPGTKFYKACKAKELVREHISKAIKMVREGQGRQGTALATIIHAADASVTDEEIKDLVTELLFAGHETLSSLFTSLIMYTRTHEDCLEKLRGELSIKGLLCSDKDDDLTFDVIEGLQYANFIVHESLRISPPVQGVLRKVVNTFDAGGYQVPSGWSAMAGIVETHRMNPFYRDGREFIPGRWDDLLSNGNNSDLRKNFLTFGSGVHMCIGKSYALTFGTIFLVELARLCDWTIKNPSPLCTFIPSFHPRDGLPTIFSERKQQ